MPRDLVKDRVRRIHTYSLICVALWVLTVVTLAPVRQFSFVDYDDLDYVATNVNVSSGVNWANSRWAIEHAYTHTGGPLTWFSYQLDAELFGTDAGAFHLVNLFIHAAAACVLFLTLAAATREVWPSAWVAAIFAVHPLHVESVAWISERKDVLAGLFTFLTMSAYLWYSSRPSSVRYLWLVLACAAALLSKPIAVTIPLLLLFLDGWPLGRFDLSSPAAFRASVMARAAEKVPLALMAVAVSILTMWSQATIGAMSSLNTVSAGERLLNAVSSLGWYVQKSVWPSGLAAIYPLRLPIPWSSVIAGTVVGAALVGLSWTQRRVRPYVTVGCLWFLAALLPVLGLLQTGAHGRADRNMYLPLVGLAVGVAWSVLSWSRRRPPYARYAVIAAAVASVLAAAWQAGRQTQHWKDSETLFRRALSVTDSNYIAATGLATTLRRRGELEEPAALYRAALRAAPSYAAARGGLGETLLAQGAADAAVYELSRAVEAAPAAIEHRVNLGSALRAAGRAYESVAQFQRARDLAPDRPDVLSGLGAALAEAGEPEAAQASLQEALRIDPDHADGTFNLALVYSRAGRSAEALGQFVRAVELNPDAVPPRAGFAALLMELGRPEEAARELGEAVRLEPDDALLRSNLAGALLGFGRMDDAMQELQAAIQLEPDNAQLRQNLQLVEEARHRKPARKR